MKIKRQENLQRMIQLADDFFGARRDPAQISVNQKEMKRLLRIHPRTLTEKRTAKGPIAWILVLPTTNSLMKKFLKNEITERELLEKTPIDSSYDAVYLCSALVLPEYRMKGIAKKLMIKSIKTIRKEHPITSLFFWGFSTAGRKLAKSVSKEIELPVLRRKA